MTQRTLHDLRCSWGLTRTAEPLGGGAGLKSSAPCLGHRPHPAQTINVNMSGFADADTPTCEKEGSVEKG
jgi:hypothetical protein